MYGAWSAEGMAPSDHVVAWKTGLVAALLRDVTLYHGPWQNGVVWTWVLAFLREAMQEEGVDD